MAEASPPEVMSDSTAQHEVSILDCPICMQSFHQPKSLPCHHTFCQECLSIFITRKYATDSPADCFPCPICRKKIIPPNPLSDPKNWSSHFPTNSFITELLSKETAKGNYMQNCNPCQKHKKLKSAIFWCKDCQFFICKSCLKEMHSYLFDNHKLLTTEDLSDHPDFVQTECPVCEKHNKSSDLFCVDHEILGCYMCILIEHKACDQLITVSEYAKYLKTEEQITEMTRMLDTGVQNLDCLNHDLQCKLFLLSEDKHSVLKKLSNFEEMFQIMMSFEVTTMCHAKEESIFENLDMMEVLRYSLLQTKLILQSLKHSMADYHLVSTVLRGRLEMTVCTETIRDYGEKNEWSRNSLTHNQDFEILKFRIETAKEEMRKQRCVSLYTSLRIPMFERAVTQVGTITVPKLSSSSGCYITGILALANGSIIMADNSNKRLLCLTTTSQVIDEILLPGHPWDLCQTPNGNIAVSVYDKKMISIIRLSDSKFTRIRNIHLPKRPLGIAFYNGHFHVTFPNTTPKQLCEVSVNGTVSRVQVFDEYNYYLTRGRLNNRLIGSLYELSPSKTTVYCIKSFYDDVVQEHIKVNVVKYAYGIETDDEDNIYVCGYGSDNVVLISADGSRARELLSSADVENPWALSILGCYLFISESFSNIVKIFQLM